MNWSGEIPSGEQLRTARQEVERANKAIESLTAQLAAERARSEKLAETLRKIAHIDSDGLESLTPQAMARTARKALAEWEAGNGRD